eukprot:jgi/Botrbrau1/21364/Bobra.0184s0070.1
MKHSKDAGGFILHSLLSYLALPPLYSPPRLPLRLLRLLDTGSEPVGTYTAISINRLCGHRHSKTQQCHRVIGCFL